MKNDYSTIIEKLESQLSELSNCSEDVEGLLNQGIERLICLNFAYENASLGEAREPIGLTPKISLFQECKSKPLESKVSCQLCT